MQKQAPSFGRILTMVLFAFSCIGLILFLWLSFGGAVPLAARGYRVQVAFPQAAELVDEADVRIAGINVGKVKGSKLDPAANKEIATLQLDPRYAPLRSDARALLRQKTLLGETYVALTTGTPKAKPIPDGGRLADGHVASNVQFDEVLQAFDPVTRQAFRDWQRELAVVGRGRGEDLSGAIGSLPAFTGDGASLLSVLDQESGAVRQLFANTGVTFDALTRDDHQLANLVRNAGATFSATAAQNRALADTFRVFPVFLRETRLTLARVRGFALDTDPLIGLLRPDLRELTPTLGSLRALSPDLRRLFVSLSPLIRVSRSGLPALSQTLRGARPLLGSLGPFVSQLNPILDYLGLYNHQVSEFLDTGEAGRTGADRKAAANGPGQPNGHFLPQIVVTGPSSVGFNSQRTAANRGNTYLPPVALALQTTARHKIFPNFDCVPSGGPKPAGAPKTATSSGTPACFVLPTIFKGQRTVYPLVRAARYRPGPR